MWWISIILHFTTFFFYSGNKMFKLAHSVVVNLVSAWVVDDVQEEAWCTQAERWGANHAHFTVAVTKHSNRDHVTLLYVCVCACSRDSIIGVLRPLTPSGWYCTVFRHQGGRNMEGNLLRALNVEVIVHHPPRATTFEVFGEFWGSGRIERWWIHRKRVFHNTLDTSGQL